MSVFERARLLGFGLLAVTFVAGALAGAAIDRGIGKDPGAADGRSAARGDGEERSYVIDRVDMAPTQRATIDSILDLRVDRMRGIWREVEPRLNAITDSARSEIMEVLTPAQRAEYDRLLEERRRRRDAARGDDGSGDRPSEARQRADRGDADR